MRNRKKNPLNRRMLREIRGEWVRYLVISLFLVLTTGFVSGVYVANNSMLTSMDEAAEKYVREDGHFTLNGKADTQLLTSLENFSSNSSKADGTKIYENFFKNTREDDNCDGKNDGDIRVYTKSDEINMASVLKGRLPEDADEIAIDRMHGDNAGVAVGDAILIGGVKYKVVGLISYVNYYTLHEKPSDFMFDALDFDVAMVTGDGFDRLNAPVQYNYAWRYGSRPSGDPQAKSLSQDLLKELTGGTATSHLQILDFAPAYSNQAIIFASDDMGSDKAMAGILLDVLIVIIAFIFLITTMGTVEKESRVIGTLLASGYTKKELVSHYLSINMAVTIFSAIVGNMLGYTLLKNIVAGMYYNSYSLPAYHTHMNPEALVKTTIIPVILVLVINVLGINWKLGHSPLQFLRQDLRSARRQKAVRLPALSFFNRFRLRVLTQNVPNYGVLLLGILFVMILLSMAVGLPESLNSYRERATDMMIAPHQYILNTNAVPETVEKSAVDEGGEKFSLITLERKSPSFSEEVMVYGIRKNSGFVKAKGLDSLKNDQVCISGDYQEKYGVSPGDKIKLKDKYSSKKYTFTVKGIYRGSSGINVFMNSTGFRESFGDNSNRFSGFFSDNKLDLPRGMVASTITKKDITKVCDQLDHSMGGYMIYFQVLCILLSAALVFLLTKTIIEKNPRSISMVKILGYTDREIGSLYLVPTTVWVVVSAAICSFLGANFMSWLWRAMMQSYSGWFTFTVNSPELIKMFLSVLAGYVIVLLLDFKHIRRIRMDLALKDIE